MAFVEVRDLSKRFGRVVAVDRVSLSIDRGEWLAVLGPSGSGKSTLLNCLAQLQVPDEGSIVLDGQDTVHLAEGERAALRREAIGIVFQQFHLLPYLTAVENVMVAQWLHSMADRSEAAAALDRVGLGDRLDHLPRQLSGGEQQRACIARALVNRPKLLLADEPTGSLDEASQASVLDLISGLHADGMTLVTVTHDLAVGRRADRELVLEHGRVSGSVTSADAAESELESVLQGAWRCVEDGVPATRETLQRGSGRRSLDACIAREYIILDGAAFRLTAAGTMRARDIVRRRRLAERLLQQALHETPAGEDDGCGRDRALAEATADATCAFLGHPRTCPHGRAVPAGGCCPA